jgi:Uma2 family endonuclease
MPELVVEVRSPSETWTRVFPKVGEYLDARIPNVVVVDAVTNSISHYQPNVSQLTFTLEMDFSLPGLFPDWKLPVAELFE